MGLHVRSLPVEFTPAEAACISGVSPALQRDWRRRGILASNNGGKWTRWQLEDVIKLSAMKLFTDTGMDVSQTIDLAHMAVMATLSGLDQIEGTKLIEGDQPKSPIVRAYSFQFVENSLRRSLGRYVVSFGPDAADCCRVDTLAELDANRHIEGKPILTIVDCHTLAARIFERAGRPLGHWFCEDKPNE